MELPISKESYLPSNEALVRAIKRVGVILARTLTEEVSLDSGTLFADPGRFGVRLASVAKDVRVPQGEAAGRAVEEICDHFTRAGLVCDSLDSVDQGWPEDLAIAITARGYTPAIHGVYRLEQYKPPSRIGSEVQVINARSVYGQLPDHLALFAREEYGSDETSTPGYVRALTDYLDEPRLDLFVGRMNQRVVASAGVVTLGNIGVIYPAYVDPLARGKGVADILLDYLIDHCSRAQFEHVLLDRLERCPSLPFYESIGFKKITAYTRYELTPRP